MKNLLLSFSLVFSVFTFASEPVLEHKQGVCPAWLDQNFKVLRKDAQFNLCDEQQGRPMLLVNTASACGFTPQFKGLEALHQQYKDLLIVGFPSDSFFQEHDQAEETAKVCYVNYGVTFTMLETSKVRGKDANGVFQSLSETLGAPSWNFNKYLVAGDGTPLQKFGSRITPESEVLNDAISKAIAAALAPSID